MADRRLTYTAASASAVVAAGLLDGAVLRTRLLRRRAFWTAYAIVVGFQLLNNGVLTGRRIVTYDEDRVVGLRIAYAPVEDLGFGFALVTTTLSVWVALGRRARRARTSAGAATATRRRSGTLTRRSRTR
jgi:lycopene cyclase domain-containing protein